MQEVFPALERVDHQELVARQLQPGVSHSEYQDMPTQKLYVSGIGTADEARIASSLMRLEGVLYAVASHSDSCVEVEFEDDCITIAELMEALNRLGFSASPAG
ncbi:hypothetical protein BH23GEM6_BH23GEM6_19600 [soil metagenome]